MMEFVKYKELMAYLKESTLCLNRHEINYSKAHPDKRDPEIHNIVQTNFPITQCMEFDGFTICWNNSFSIAISLYERCFKSHPENFHTGNANDILQTLYNNSGYWRSYNDYKLYLLSESCCYIIEHKNEGYGDILRLDLYRQEDIKKEGTEFTGGLFHCLRHFSIKGMNLYDRRDVNDVSSICEIVYILGKCFAKKHGNEECYEYDINSKRYSACFYHEIDSEVYFIKTFRRE